MFKNENFLISDVFETSGLSVEDIALLTGISRATLYKVKNTGVMSPKTFVKIYALYIKLHQP